MATDWIADARKKEREFFENATPEQIDAALDAANYEEYKDYGRTESYSVEGYQLCLRSVSDHANRESIDEHVAHMAYGRLERAADDFSYTMAA